ncbi:MAG: alpha/beta fold hydrolase [Thermoguttaceae bacterium]
MSVVSKSIVVQSQNVHYLQSGSHCPRTVLLLHGASFKAETWRQIGTLDILPKEGYQAVAVDMPGFGDSAGSLESLDPKQRKQWIGDLLTALEIERPVVVAPSLSGYLVLPWLIANPQSASGLVAVAPVAIEEHARKLKKITVPVLAIWGEKDQHIPQEQADQLVGTVAEGRKVVLRGAGHAAYMNDPGAFHFELIGFLRRVLPMATAQAAARRS